MLELPMPTVMHHAHARTSRAAPRALRDANMHVLPVQLE